jgi:hypothetical protein
MRVRSSAECLGETHSRPEDPMTDREEEEANLDLCKATLGRA